MPMPEAQAALESIAANVRRIRTRVGLTQEALAEVGGFDVRFVQKIERAKLNVSVETLVRLALALDVTPGVLLRTAVLEPPKPGRPKRRRATRYARPKRS